MTLEQVVQSELGDEFIAAAESLGREPAEVLTEVLQQFIVTIYATEPRANSDIISPRRQREPGDVPAIEPATTRLDATNAGVLGLWADRPESGAAIARRLRDANNRGRHYAD